MKQVLALIEKPEHVCYRYRVEAFSQALQRDDWVVTPFPLLRGIRQQEALLRAVCRADVVVLQRKLLPCWKLWMIRRAAKRLIYDIDDAIFFRDSNARKTHMCSRRAGRFHATMRAADVVTVGNEFLRRTALNSVPAAHVVRIPTCVSPELYPLARHARPRNSVDLVWIGSRSTLPSLKHIQDSLAIGGKASVDWRLKVICDTFPQSSPVPLVRCQWDSNSEARDLAEADIGVSWLPDHPWSFGKCGLKVLQYMAAGLPVVANRLGVHRELIQHGHNGFLADSPIEWYRAVRDLAASPALRTEMGRNARRFVTENYNVARWAECFARQLRTVPNIVPCAAPVAHSRAA